MIDIEAAVSAAKDFARRLYSGAELTQMRVEEIEATDDDKFWLITLGWVEPAVRQMGGIMGQINSSIEPLPRVYKVFRVNSDSGAVVSMKIRD